MRRVLYSVAMSPDGYIAGPDGELDWIVMDPDIDFAAKMQRFDTVLMARKTYAAAQAKGGGGAFGKRAIVFSNTLRQKDCKGVSVSNDVEGVVSSLRSQPGKDIWLFGGGEHFRSVLSLNLVDGVQAAIVPVLLGKGAPFPPEREEQAKLPLKGHRTYKKREAWFSNTPFCGS